MTYRFASLSDDNAASVVFQIENMKHIVRPKKQSGGRMVALFMTHHIAHPLLVWVSVHRDSLPELNYELLGFIFTSCDSSDPYWQQGVS
jgi:hypothetical protein